MLHSRIAVIKFPSVTSTSCTQDLLDRWLPNPSAVFSQDGFVELAQALKCDAQDNFS